MPPTVHKVLVHGAELVKHSYISIGMLSEEALEANHKIIRHTRLNYRRKISCESTNKDPVERMILMSEPKISILRQDEK